MIDIYNALITRLTTATIANITTDDIAYDNADFDPTDKDAWLSTNFIFVERGGSSKTLMSAEDTGLFQVDVFVPLNDATGGTKRYNLRALEIVGDLLNAYPQFETLSFNSTNVEIEESTLAAPLISESWYQVPVTINFRRL